MKIACGEYAYRALSMALLRLCRHSLELVGYGDGPSNVSYYHFSSEPLDAGFVLTPTGKSHLGDKVEALLNQHKPPAARARAESVFLRCDQDFGRTGVAFDHGYVLKVEPLGEVSRHDEVWLGLLKNRYHHNERIRRAGTKSPLSDRELCVNYWLGVASPNPYWEILTSSAKVLERITPMTVSRMTSPPP